MDWYLRSEDEFLENNTINSLNIFKDPSEFELFRNNNNELADYEIKPIDFCVDQSLTTKSNSSKPHSPSYQVNERI